MNVENGRERRVREREREREIQREKVRARGGLHSVADHPRNWSKYSLYLTAALGQQ